jgi:putative oxidoreductase
MQTSPATYGQNAWPTNVNKALLLVRVVVGLLFVGHASQKLFGLFGGQGMAPFVESMNKMGAQPAPFWAYFAATGELVAGVLLVLGLLTPFAAATLVAQMVVAAVEVHGPRGFWNQQGGFEYPLVLGVVVAAVGLTGPGVYSLDNRLPLALPKPWTFLVAAAIGLAVALFFVIRP